MLVNLICPACRTPLKHATEEARCPGCGKHYGYHRGILCFLPPDETLNETPYEEKQTDAWAQSAALRDRIRSSKVLSFVNTLRINLSLSGRRDRVFYREMAGKGGEALILDVGCGGGRHYFTDYGRVIGLDPVLDLLQGAKALYSEVYQGDAAAMPFADNTFDYVVSSDVIGHLPEQVKERCFEEMYRVLKPGGRTVHVIETDSSSGWFRLAHQFPALFQEYFVDRPGHIGLESPTKLVARFKRHGFKPVRLKRMGSNIQECGMIAALFDNQYREARWWLPVVAGLDKLLARNLATKELTNLLLEPLAQIDDLLSPMDHASGMLVVFEK